MSVFIGLLVGLLIAYVIIVAFGADVTTVAAFAATATAVSGAVAATGAWSAARRTRTATEAQLLTEALREYSGEEMRDALTRLREWRYQHPEDAGPAYKELYESNPTEWRHLSRARRTVTSFFLRAVQLHEAGYVGDVYLQQVAAGQTGYRLLLEVGEALAWAHADSRISEYPYTRDRFDRLVEVCGTNGVERFQPPSDDKAG